MTGNTSAAPPAPLDLIIHSSRLVSGGSVTSDAFVAFTGDTVALVGSGTAWRELDAVETVDASGLTLTPGFIDIHGHGGNAHSFDDGADSIRSALRVHRAHGTTRSVLSLVTASVDTLVDRVRIIADLADSDPTILGSHLEGPFLDVGHQGAHDPELLRAPDSESIERLVAAARGTLRQVTLAPELPGGLEALHQFVDAGVVVGIGHTNTDFAGACDAFTAGASILTHAFNAMNGIHHRSPGPVAAAIATNSVTLEIINDGVHVHPEVVRLAFAAAPGRIALITDAMAAAGSDDGTYQLGSLSVTVTDGVARLTEGNSIAGSTLTLDEALRRAVRDVGLTLVDSVTALTSTPARAIGRADDLGQLAPGFGADAVLLDDDLRVRSVWAAGVLVRH
ncbi:N-acetylglucosamine-6-phosphate deacetylase [Okibacterium sp. HSC-33S16]|uniref:N-acetylglucosamine-6-phosphate deacetylase n=1 Tax=Okibacterium sp. HSC-33S16 TaxID=2910965 RepID=UPI0020A1324A|nr:N-acetylglucosamine-6-phosphate deacetylase [Okibacterium sp. HSC-33S16]MCP2030115.1 N-acetylglucosamine-6-phosphate deacetylase [Okibacterium sp. HSC-33S16]